MNASRGVRIVNKMQLTHEAIAREFCGEGRVLTASIMMMNIEIRTHRTMKSESRSSSDGILIVADLAGIR